MTKFLDLSRELRADGFVEARGGRRRHIVFTHPEYGNISVPNHPGKEIRPGLVKELRCQVARVKRGLRRFETMK